MRITQDVRAFAMEQAGRRCECTGKNCRHHLSGARCKRGLRGDQWKVYWRAEGGGATRENIEAWCLECFSNNFEVPRERVALLATDIFAYARLLQEDRRRAITLKSVLRDAAERIANEHRGRLVLDRLDDDVLSEFPTSQEGLEAARKIRTGFEEIAQRLDLSTPELCGVLHYGEVTRWRNGLLAGEAVDLVARVRSIAGLGEIVVTQPAADALRDGEELSPIADDIPPDLASAGGVWSLSL